MLSLLDCELALARWRGCWKHWGGKRAVNLHTHGSFMDKTFDCSVGKEPYMKQLARLIPQLRVDSSI